MFEVDAFEKNKIFLLLYIVHIAIIRHYIQLVDFCDGS